MWEPAWATCLRNWDFSVMVIGKQSIFICFDRPEGGNYKICSVCPESIWHRGAGFGKTGSLYESGRKLAVASSKPHCFVKQILERFDIEKYFDVIVGSELDGTRGAKEEVVVEGHFEGEKWVTDYERNGDESNFAVYVQTAALYESA